MFDKKSAHWKLFYIYIVILYYITFTYTFILYYVKKDWAGKSQESD